MSGLIVTKYGGSIIRSSSDIETIRDITQDDSRRKIVVVSAPSGVTNMLIELSKTRKKDVFDRVIGKYDEVFPGHRDIASLLEQRVNAELPEEQYSALIKAFGEEACARLMADFLGAEYVDPGELFLLRGDFDNAKILSKSRQRIKKRLSKLKTIAVVPGFYGYTKDGKVATFSRGGSDLTASYVAASLDAALYENFKEVDGIFAASPELVPDAHKISEITYTEIRDLAYSGFKVFHQEAMEPVAIGKIPVHVRNMFAYPSQGTYIVHDRISDPDKPIIGVAYRDGFCSFDIGRFGLNEEIGLLRKLAQVFEKNGISIEFTAGAIDDISFILRQEQLKGPNAIGDITDKINSAINNAEIDFQENLGSLVVAGKGLRGKRGITADVQSTLASKGINIRFISQGSEERCIVYGVDSSDGKKAVNAIYDRYLR